MRAWLLLPLPCWLQTVWREKDTVGVQDSVLLDNYTDERVFIDNLEKRFKKNFVYVIPSLSPFWSK